MNNKRYEGSRTARNEEIVRVPPDLKDRVIGLEHRNIEQIRETSGAFVKICTEGFSVRGSLDQRECAKKLIQDIVNPSQTGIVGVRNQEIFSVKQEFKGRVIGKGGRNIKMIKEKSGAFVQVCAEGFVIRGSDEQREWAKTLIQDVIKPSSRSMTSSIGEEAGNQEIVKVDEEVKGRVIGKRGCNIHMIREKTGASVEDCVGGFLVRGLKEQRESARSLILQILKPLEESGELADIPEEYRGAVIGKNGQILNEISTRTGAFLFRVGWEVHMSGPQEAQDWARLEIKRLVAKARISERYQRPRASCFVDDFNFQDYSELILSPLVCTDIPRTQYRLQLNDQGCERDSSERDSSVSEEPPSYLGDLKESVLQSLMEIKKQFEEGKQQRIDMWCHFGTIVIENVDEADAEERGKIWTLEEILGNLPVFSNDKEEKDGTEPWRTNFKEGVTVNEVFHLGQLQKPLYDTRYDLRFLTPSGREVRCKVWVKEKEHEEEEGKIPFDDVKNIIEEVCFKDERTSDLCKGWLCLASVKKLKADIAFPACDFDCRLTIRARFPNLIGDPLAKEGIPTDENENLILRDFVSNMTVCEEENDDLVLPGIELPTGFYVDYRRCCRRSVFPYGCFTIIVSKETSFLCQGKTENKIEEKTDLHLHCNKWDQLLRYGQWEPQDIVEMLPEFLSFVKKVQELIVHQTKCNDQ